MSWPEGQDRLPQPSAQESLDLTEFRTDRMDPVDRPRRRVVRPVDMRGARRNHSGLTGVNRKRLAGQRQPSLPLETPEKDEFGRSVGPLAMVPSGMRIMTDVARREFQQRRRVQPGVDDRSRQNDGALARETFSNARRLITFHGAKGYQSIVHAFQRSFHSPWIDTREDAQIAER